MDNPLRYQASSDSASRSAPPTKSGTWKDFIHITKPGILRTNLIAVFGGFWLASQWDVDYGKLMLTLLGTVLIMASSCVFNNYFDRELDLKMERTRNRSLPTGRLTPKVVLSYAIILGVLGLIILFSFSGALAGLCGMFGMFVYVIMYTLWLKRSSTWSTSIGGLSGAMPPVIGYVAVTGRMDLGAWLLLAMLFLWQPPHFWALAIRRVEDYRAGGFPLLPVVKGIERTKIQMIPYLVLQIFVPILMYAYGYAGIFYLTVSLILSVLWLYYALKGFRAKNTDAWAKKVFLYSINYLSLSFILMILDTVHK
ncbi:heme o synthase [Paenibacillus sp. UMB7766-LJ446]|uniref:heme o synthase n=1 Tax=Paenibacillus sp. UMB7766-LJ446 TaxID=3046313 RepID=UPI00254F0F42|nr:heme o synthase [Paenibacillus sp. UMB7766-LJ446]MDK8192188.1 heme o synthase [Paenibacillus sp. UMB7766-LJ446]